MGQETIFLLWVQFHRTSFLDKLALNVTALGSEFVLPAIAVVGLIGAWKGAKHGIEVVSAAGAMLLCLAAVEVLKHVVGRERPTLPIALAWETSPSFPSAHAAMSMVVFPILALLAGKVWFWPAVALALLIGLTRVYAGVHFPSDVIAGWLIGACCVHLYSLWTREV